jgi:outer membrane murein-binding lipoprotein Lpp
LSLDRPWHKQFSTGTEELNLMHKANPWVVAFLMIGTMSLGLWGCGQQSGAFAAKVREMEARHSKLEEDYKAISAANEQGRKKIAQAEARLKEALVRVQDLGKQVEELQVVVQERDELRKQLLARTGERDAAQTQFAQFSQELQTLAGRVQAAAATNPGPALTVAIPASRKSE